MYRETVDVSSFVRLKELEPWRICASWWFENARNR